MKYNPNDQANDSRDALAIMYEKRFSRYSYVSKHFVQNFALKCQQPFDYRNLLFAIL